MATVTEFKPQKEKALPAPTFTYEEKFFREFTADEPPAWDIRVEISRITKRVNVDPKALLCLGPLGTMAAAFLAFRAEWFAELENTQAKKNCAIKFVQIVREACEKLPDNLFSEMQIGMEIDCGGSAITQHSIHRRASAVDFLYSTDIIGFFSRLTETKKIAVMSAIIFELPEAICQVEPLIVRVDRSKHVRVNIRVLARLPM